MAKVFFQYAFLSLLMMPVAAMAAPSGERPALTVTDSPVPQSILERAYSTPARVRDITPAELIGTQYYKPTETIISRKVNDLRNELSILQDKVAVLSEAIGQQQRSHEGVAANYYAAIATINTQLQSGTTPGNPRLIERLSTAEVALENIGQDLSKMNEIAVDTSKVATEATFLVESARAAYGLSGAVEEDHVKLAGIEDTINATIVMIERLLNTVNDSISRTSAYMVSERDNLRTLSLAVTQGSLYGRNLGERPFSGLQQAKANAAVPSIAGMNAPAPVASTPDGLRPLVKIRFDRPDVDFEQSLYMAVNEALERYPNAAFTVLALHPSTGNAAEVAIESTRARRNADQVLRTLSQIGLSPDQIDISYDQNGEISSNEVHVFIR